MRNMLNIEQARGIRAGESNTPSGKNYTLKGVFTAMVRKVENNISRVQLWLQIVLAVFTISCVVLPWGYNQLVEKGREQERQDNQRKAMDSLSKELQDLKKAVEAPKATDTTEEETVTPKPKPRKPQSAKAKRQNLTGQIPDPYAGGLAKFSLNL